jgi:CheY-like chemotaxis protein
MSLIGSLEDLALGDILQILSLSRRSGVLYLTRKGEEGKIVFIDGQIVSASNNENPNDILKLLNGKGIMDNKKMEELANQIEKSGSTDAKSFLIKSKIAGEDVIENVIQNYINDIIFGFFSWTEGNFDFEITENLKEIYKPQLECYLAVPLNPQYIAIEGARKTDEKRKDRGFEEEQKDEFALQIREMEEFIVVDQNADSQAFLKESLESRGFRTSVMSDLSVLYEYLETIKDSPRFPMIIADLTIPKTKGEVMLGGMELLKWGLENKIKAPVILLSSVNNEEVLKEAKLNGVYAYLKKPKKFSRTSPDIDTYMEILEKVTTLFRQYQEAGFTFKPGLKDIKPKTNVVSEDEDTGYRFVQDITEELTKEFQDEIELLPETTGQKVDTSPGLLTLKSMIDELMRPNFTGEVTLLIMRFASELLNRGILFLVTKDKIKGLGQFGLEAFFDNPNVVVKKMEIEVDEHSIIGKVLKYKVPVKETPEQTDGNKKFISQIGGEWPVESYVVPLLTANRVAAIFYGDNVPFKKKISDMTTFEIFMSQASIVMEKAYLERIIRDRKDEQ